jgi:DNA-3-methyladenine glycosylase
LLLSECSSFPLAAKRLRGYNARGMKIEAITREEMPVAPARLARWLIGKTLVRDEPAGRIAGRIVETEAYLQTDSASHTFRGKTARNASMFLERGHAYVYFIYGCWFSLNVSAGREGVGNGVLLRALEPIEGVGLMQERRKAPAHALARGPGCLATALHITRELDGIDLCRGRGPLWLGQAVRRRGRMGVSGRIGLSRETERQLRFYEIGNPSVSGRKTVA